MSFEIIDFHMHPFYNKENNLNMYKEVMDLNSDDIKKDMDTYGISKFCGSIIKADSSFSSIHQSNLETLKLRDIWGDSFIPGFHVSPLFPEESIKEVDFAYDNGVKLIGELVPYYHGWEDYANDNFSVLLDHIAKYKMIVSLHTQGLDRMEIMAKKHPDITFVFAHPGERNILLQHIDVMKNATMYIWTFQAQVFSALEQ